MIVSTTCYQDQHTDRMESPIKHMVVYVIRVVKNNAGVISTMDLTYDRATSQNHRDVIGKSTDK
jgi:phenolic acid decarboxylase